MGTWGTGNFDNDEALDAYAEVVDDLLDRIDEGLGEGQVHFEDVGAEIALVEVLAALGERCREVSVPRAKVERWKERVLSAYDAQIDDLGATESFKAERRRVLEATFDRLLGALASPPKATGP